MCVIAPLGPFSDHNDISLPLHIPEMLKVVKLLPFQVNIPEAWKSYPFQAEPFRIGHYRDYSPGELKEKGINHLCHIRWNVCSNLVPRAFPLKNRWGAWQRPTHSWREKPWGRGCVCRFLYLSPVNVDFEDVTRETNIWLRRGKQ